MRRKTVLIFGVSGFIGSNIAEFLKNKYRVVGTYHSNKVQIDGVMTMPCDVLNRDQVQLMVFTYQPDFTIYCVGLTSVENCYNHPKLADALNTVGLFNVTETSERYKARIILISSAYVFNGEGREFLESDTPDPNTMYGKTKISAEFFIQKSCLNYLILRCGRFYGRSLIPRQRSFFESMEEKIAEGEVIKIDNQVREGFLDVTFLGQIISLCIQKNTSNRLFQISSKDIMSHYEFGKAYSKTFKNNETLVTKGAWPFYQLEGYPGSSSGLNYHMDVFNAESYFGINFPTIQESLQYTYTRFGGNMDAKVSSNNDSSVKFI